MHPLQARSSWHQPCEGDEFDLKYEAFRTLVLVRQVYRNLISNQIYESPVIIVEMTPSQGWFMAPNPR
ncbi:MAG: hypothetical protein ABL888_20955 [Pirellulaceae bacterium]